VLLSLIGPPARDDPQHVNYPSLIVSRENYPPVANAETKTGPSRQASDINVSPLGMCGQFVQFAANALGVLTRHILPGFDGLPLDRQFVQRIPHSRNIANSFISVKLFVLSEISQARERRDL
jgi:hypothetical protein